MFGWNKDEGRMLFFIKLICTVIFRNRFAVNNCFAQYPMAFFEAKSHWESFGVAVMLQFCTTPSVDAWAHRFSASFFFCDKLLVFLHFFPLWTEEKGGSAGEIGILIFFFSIVS